MLCINLGHGVMFKIHILASEYNILDLFPAVRSDNVIIEVNLTDDIITTLMKPLRHAHDLQPLHFSLISK